MRAHGDRAVIHCSRALVVFLFLVVSVSCVSAQGGGGVDVTGTGGRHSILGRIYFPSGIRADVHAKVKLQSFQYTELTVLADLNGTFSFKSLAPGSYTVVVEGGDEYETSREAVLIDGEPSNRRRGIEMPSIPRSYQVQIYLQPKRIATNKPGVVNAELAGIAEPARTYYEKGITFVKAGEPKKAVEQLKLAVTHAPEFVLALNELGVQYLKLGEADNAVQVLQKATKLKPEAFLPQLNYGVALLQTRKFRDAETQLRQAAGKNGTVATVHMYLGMTLIQLSNYDEAESELVRALELAGSGTHMAQAHYYLGGIYWRKKQYKLAADQLETYLKQSPNASDAERVKATIVSLREKS
jgi:tetratricopeptide (TPR) repeat protein